MKAHFVTDLFVHKMPSGDDILISPLGYYSAILARDIVIPAGFVTDYASVPRLPLAYLLFGGVADSAAVVHDFLYSTGLVSRKLADDVFAEASEACGVPAWRRRAMWLGVRLFGGSRYSPPPVTNRISLDS